MQLFLQIYFLLLTHNCAIATDCLLDDCQIAGLLAQAGLLDCQIAMDCLWIARLVIGCIVHCCQLCHPAIIIRRGLPGLLDYWAPLPYHQVVGAYIRCIDYHQ